MNRDVSSEDYQKVIGRHITYYENEEINNEIEDIREMSERKERFFEEAPLVYQEIEKEFFAQTKLTKEDFAFLLVATGLQCLRIFLINKITKKQRAGKGNKNEETLHSVQDKILGEFDVGNNEKSKLYHASMKHIVSTRGVPYDVTSYEKHNDGLLKDANHRFSTLGHDPILGLVFGTSNIMTNTISCVNLPFITVNHVKYDAFMKNPKISEKGSNVEMFYSVINRIKEEPRAFVAAMIKQIIHIGTDLYTPCGIQLPFANLVLSKDKVEKITKYLGTGEVLKGFVSGGIKELIDCVFTTLHLLCYKEEYGPLDLYSCRTKKIINLADVIAETSDIIWVGANVYEGNFKAIFDLDIGGLITTVGKLIRDIKFVNCVQEEFIKNRFIERMKNA